ncbi:zinc ribbon domain-containing protein [Thermogemmatispora onikobensis]|uniref:zinc ribbon domain-containing protein n=1 Tax=Thermogemmatispora onikobensis TaxID=732234 RepID=UPI000853B870|nr:zinc ribbon domain-containing protein [Thermogemmatispora onikobensis]
MEQRIYHGTLSPDGLADYLVQTFGQNYSYLGWGGSTLNTIAQKIGQGDHVLVQIAQARPWSGRLRTALGVSISRVPDGISVSVGQSNWLEGSLPGMLWGALFFPPLVIFPLIRSIGAFSFYQDVWQAIETYCTQAQATRISTSTLHGLYCARCGALNDEAAQHCHLCGAALAASPASTAGAPELVTCASCHERVVAARFCGNCGAPLSAGPAPSSPDQGQGGQTDIA